MRVYFIVPAVTGVAGQCRIVVRETDQKVDARRSYWLHPGLWQEAGIMSSRGDLVCLDDAEAFRDMKGCEPLMAGMQFEYGGAS